MKTIKFIFIIAWIGFIVTGNIGIGYTESGELLNIEPNHTIKDGIKIISDTYDPSWRDFPDIKTKVIIDSKTYFWNYKEYWNDFLLCDPYPDSILKVITSDTQEYNMGGDFGQGISKVSMIGDTGAVHIALSYPFHKITIYGGDDEHLVAYADSSEATGKLQWTVLDTSETLKTILKYWKEGGFK